VANALGLAFRQLLAEQPAVFENLFDPARGGGWGYLPAPEEAELFAVLRAFRMVDGEPGGDVRGLHRVRTRGERFYVMEIDRHDVYRQDVWPETDAMLALLDGAPPGRLADIGTGCGIVAIEAAARGHRVVATDLHGVALELARANAALNGLEGAIEFRQGHLFAPLADEKFDLILTAPHYGRIFDQLRLEVLTDGPRCLAPGGRLGLATQLEWQADGPLAAEHLLRPLAERGARVRVEPIVSTVKREWFKLARGEDPHLVSRHRFLITVENGAGPGALDVARPALDAIPVEEFVPLARLLGGGAREGRVTATVATADDFARLGALADALGAPDATLDGPLPSALLDACRFGARACVGHGAAAGAILDAAGGVRPCTHGGVVARAEDPLARVDENLRALAAAAAARRGCAACPAEDTCSRCLFPAACDETAYCDFIRSNVRRLPILHRLLDTLAVLARADALAAPLAVRRWPRRAWSIDDVPPSGDDLRNLERRWNQSETWTIASGEGAFLFWLVDDRLRHAAVEPPAAALGGRIADGATRAELETFAQSRALPRWMVGRAIEHLTFIFV